MQPGQHFARGSMVLATLHNPREKFWGMVLSLDQAGISLQGIDLHSFDDFAHLVKAGEPATAGVVFFPMHRVERIEADSRNGGVPSLSEQFAHKAGSPISSFFAELEQ